MGARPCSICVLTAAHPRHRSRAASQIVLNLLVPSLLFAKARTSVLDQCCQTLQLPADPPPSHLHPYSLQVVPSITSDNANAIGPIILVGFSLILMNGLMGLIVRSCTRTPHNFRWGILAAASFSNWGGQSRRRPATCRR